MPSITFKDVPYFVVEPEAGKSSKNGKLVNNEHRTLTTYLRWGVNEQIKKQTARFSAALNAIAITPDLYRGKVASKADEANHLMSSLNWPGAVEDIRHAAEWLRSKGCTKIGVVGFCMGGALTIASVVHVPEIDAGICFYGIPPKQLADPINIKKPVQYHFGDKDKSPGFSDIAACDGLRDGLKGTGKHTVLEIRHDEDVPTFVSVKAHPSAGPVQEFHRYKHANHAFMNEEAPAYPFDETLSKVALAQSLEFFKAYLA